MSSSALRLSDISDVKLRTFFKEVLRGMKHTPPGQVEVEKLLAALDQYKGPPNNRSNGIPNRNDYQAIISGNADRRGIDISYPYFGYAVRFLEGLRSPSSPMTPDYSCNFLPNDRMRQPHLYPDKAIVSTVRSSIPKQPPRFQVRFETKHYATLNRWVPLNIRSSLDIIPLKSGSIRFELFKSELDRLKGRVASSMEVSLDEIRRRDKYTAKILTNYPQVVKDFEVSDELLGYIYRLVKGKGGAPVNSGHKPFEWLYLLFAIPKNIKPEELPAKIIGYHNGDPVRAIKAIRDSLLSRVLTFMPSYFFEEEIEIAFQSSFYSQFDKSTMHDRFLGMLAKIDVLISIQSNQKMLCTLYGLHQQLRGMMFSYVFDTGVVGTTPLNSYRKKIVNRLKEVVKSAEELMPHLGGLSKPKDVIAKVVKQVERWFPDIHLSKTTLKYMWRLVDGRLKDYIDRDRALLLGLIFLRDAVHNSLSLNKALTIVRRLVLRKSSIPKYGKKMKDFAEFLRQLKKDAFLSAVTVPKKATSKYCSGKKPSGGCWKNIRGRMRRNPPNSLLTRYKFYLSSGQGIYYGFGAALHETFHAVQDYGHILLNGLKFDDYKIGDKVKRRKLPRWLTEGLAEYFSQREMRRRGLHVQRNSVSYKGYVFAIRSLIRKFGQPLEDAFVVAHMTGDFTPVRDILDRESKRIFPQMMKNRRKKGAALKWVRNLGINTQFDDWR